MKRKQIIYVGGVAIASFVVPTLALAACSSSVQGGLVSPLTFCNIQDFVAGALRILVLVALPIIAFFIVVVGFKFVVAQGNSEKLKAARNNFMWVIAGAVLILGAWVLSTLIGATVSQLVG